MKFNEYIEALLVESNEPLDVTFNKWTMKDLYDRLKKELPKLSFNEGGNSISHSYGNSDTKYVIIEKTNKDKSTLHFEVNFIYNGEIVDALSTKAAFKLDSISEDMKTTDGNLIRTVVAMLQKANQAMSAMDTYERYINAVL